MVTLLQAEAGQQPSPWTTAQVHDTVAKIAAQARYSGSLRETLLGRLFRFIIERITDIVDFFRGSLNARITLIATAIIVVAIIGGRAYVAWRVREERRLGLGLRASAGGRADFWALARDEAMAGRYAEACHATYAAVIELFARQGFVIAHASKTSGDYARDLRRSRAGATLAGDFRVFARQFDRTVFGGGDITADDYARLRDSAERATRVKATA